MDYIELEIEFQELHPWRDILISTLADKGFDSFVETKTGLKSYIPENVFPETEIQDIFDAHKVVSFKKQIIKDQNWNAKWEENFDPVFVEDKVLIKAPFHSADLTAEMVIIIQPQMSFGTGHHQTTWLMCNRIHGLDLDQKDVLDMGTGTGVLAILAEKKGAKNVFAPDIDEWSFNNAAENIALNNCNRIETALGDHQTVAGRSFDVIIANINKNVLVEQFSVYSECLKAPGILLISGFFESDQEDLKNEAAKHGFIFEETYTKDEWVMMEFKR